MVTKRYPTALLLPISAFFTQKARLETIEVTISDTIVVPSDEHWLLLNGSINHTSGAADIFEIAPICALDGSAAVINFTATIASADTTDDGYDIFGIQTTEKHGGWCPHIIPPKGVLIFTTGASGKIIIQVLKVKG